MSDFRNGHWPLTTAGERLRFFFGFRFLVAVSHNAKFPEARQADGPVGRSAGMQADPHLALLPGNGQRAGADRLPVLFRIAAELARDLAISNFEAKPNGVVPIHAPVMKGRLGPLLRYH